MINTYDIIKKYTETVFENEQNYEDPCILEALSDGILSIIGSRQSGKTKTLENIKNLIIEEYEGVDIYEVDDNLDIKNIKHAENSKESYKVLLADVCYIPLKQPKYKKAMDFITEVQNDYDLIVYTDLREHKGIQTILKIFESKKVIRDEEESVDACAIEVVNDKYIRVYGKKDSGQTEVAEKLIDIEKELSPLTNFDKVVVTNNNYRKMLKRINSNIINNIQTIVVQDNLKSPLTKDELLSIQKAINLCTLYIVLEETTSFKTIKNVKVWNDYFLENIVDLFNNNFFKPNYFKYTNSTYDNKVVIRWDDVNLKNFDIWKNKFRDNRLEVDLISHKINFESLCEDTYTTYIESYVVADDSNINFLNVSDNSKATSIKIEDIKSIEMCIENSFKWEYFVKGLSRHIAETQYKSLSEYVDILIENENYSMYCYLNIIEDIFLHNIKIKYRINTKDGLSTEFKFNLSNENSEDNFEQLTQFRYLTLLLHSECGDYPFDILKTKCLSSNVYNVANYLQNNEEFNDMICKNIKK